MAKKMTMKELEKSPQDKRADRMGLHGKEGSKKDMAMDRKLLAKINARRK